MRIIAAVSVLDNRVVQSKRWQVQNAVGSIRHVLRALDRYEVDEIVVNNIRRESSSFKDGLLHEISHADVFTPLTLGGGIRSVADFNRYYEASPERVFFSSALMSCDESLIKYACSVIGQQGMVAFMPFRMEKGKILFFNPSINQFCHLSDKTLELIKRYFDEVVFYNTDKEGVFCSVAEIKEYIAGVREYCSGENGFIYGGGVRPSLLNELHGMADAIMIENSLLYQEEPLKMSHLSGG